jgi:outer membrane receptor protein involved in Fe transport
MAFHGNAEWGRRMRVAFLATSLLCAPSIVIAQTVPQQPASEGGQTLAEAAEPDPQNTGEDIVVTGSRLIRTDLTAPSPIAVVDEALIRSAGNVTIENTLNQFPQLGGGNSSSVNNGGGSGILTANLRGLGASRTLVLVNGRRFIPADSAGLVDLSTIPDALVSRTEIITGGASAVYGSDAIAGAVNFILKQDFEGFEGSYQYGQTFRDDGASHKIDLTFGANLGGGRGNVVVSGSYTKRDPVFQADRSFAQVPLGEVNGKLVYSGSGNVPGTRVGLSSAQRAQLVGVAPPTGPCTAVTGIVFGANGAPQAYCTPESSYNYAPFNYLLRPLERYQVSAIAHYEIADGVEAFAEAYYINTQNQSVLAPDSFVPITPGAPSQTLLVPNYATNPSLSPATRQFFIDNTAIFDPNNTGTASVVGGGRRADELSTRDNYYERNSLNLTAGLRGDFDIGGGTWRWETFFQYQRNKSDTRTEGMISQTRLALGLDTVVNAQGQVVCRNAILGCVPVNIFGFNSITPQAGTFLTPPRVSSDLFERKVAGASLSGSLFDLPAGPVAIALGVEYRDDQYESFPSPLDLANEYGAVSTRPTAGGYDVKEIFGEIGIPILSDRPFFHRLELEGAARFSDYSNIGSVFTWKVGGQWAPIDWVRFRGNYNRAIRAPNIGELFNPISEGFTSGTDPCANNNKSAEVRAFCIAQGVPAADVDNFQQAALGFNLRSGGNPNLEEERSKTLTLGVVVSPPFVSRLNITVDYFKVEVSNGIAAISANQTVTDCFANRNLASPTCQAITRLPNGQIDTVSTQQANLASIKAEGLDVQLDYQIPLSPGLSVGGGSATVTLQAIGSWLFESSRQVLASQAPLDCAGRFGNGCIGTGAFGVPDFKLNLSATYNSDPLTVRLAARQIGRFELYPGATNVVKKASAQWYADLSAAFRITKEFEINGGINNLFDNKPPILGVNLSGDANTDPSLWDVVGRRFFVGARVRF